MVILVYMNSGIKVKKNNNNLARHPSETIKNQFHHIKKTCTHI